MSLKYRPEIDGLRTIAVLAVVIYHAKFDFDSGYFMSGGFFGVDVFFVISGFLITSLIMTEQISTGRFSILNFYERRARRLLPALLAVMLASLPFAWGYLLPTQLIDFSKSLISSLFFGSNFYWHYSLQEYGAESSLLKPFLHTWSLAVEEQYYIIFPLMLLAIYRWCRKYTVLILSAGFLMSLLFAASQTVLDKSNSFYMLPSRFWELLAGGILAYVMHLHPLKENTAVLKATMPLLGLVFIAYSIVFVSFESSHPGFVTLLPVIGTVLIIWFANEKDFVTRLLSSKVFVAIGLISYSLYLWHFPIFAFGRIIDSSPLVLHKTVWISLSFALSIASYFLVEKPFRNRKNITRRKLVVSTVLLSMMVTVFCLYTIHYDGLKSRFQSLSANYGKNEFDNKILRGRSWEIIKDLAREAGASDIKAFASKPSLFESEYLWFSRSQESIKVLVIGNSISKDVFNALYLNSHLFRNVEFARFGMAPKFVGEQVEVLLESPNFLHADKIIISPLYGKVSTKNLPGFISKLKEFDKSIYLTSNPTMFYEIEKLHVFDWYIQEKEKPGQFSEDELRQLFFENLRPEKQKSLNSELEAIARENGIQYLDKSDLICDKSLKTCDGMTPDGYKSFYDHTHWTLEGARHFGSRMYKLNWLEMD